MEHYSIQDAMQLSSGIPLWFSNIILLNCINIYLAKYYNHSIQNTQ